MYENSRSKDLMDKVVAELKNFQVEQEALTAEIKKNQEHYRKLISDANTLKKYLLPKKLREYFSQ